MLNYDILQSIAFGSNSQGETILSAMGDEVVLVTLITKNM